MAENGNGKISFDFSPHFWVGLVIFLSTAISSGTIHLTHAIPDDAIPYVVAWSSIISIVGSGYLTAALGLHNASPQAKVQALKEIAKDPTSPVVGIITTADEPGRQLAAQIDDPSVVAPAGSASAASISKA